MDKRVWILKVKGVLLGCCLAQAFGAALPDAVPVAAVSNQSPPAADKPVHVSPYALAARRHALEAEANAPLLVVPPSQRRTRQAIGLVQH